MANTGHVVVIGRGKVDDRAKGERAEKNEQDQTTRKLFISYRHRSALQSIEGSEVGELRPEVVPG